MLHWSWPFCNLVMRVDDREVGPVDWHMALITKPKFESQGTHLRTGDEDVVLSNVDPA